MKATYVCAAEIHLVQTHIGEALKRERKRLTMPVVGQNRVNHIQKMEELVIMLQKTAVTATDGCPSNMFLNNCRHILISTGARTNKQ